MHTSDMWIACQTQGGVGIRVAHAAVLGGHGGVWGGGARQLVLSDGAHSLHLTAPLQPPDGVGTPARAAWWAALLEAEQAEQAAATAVGASAGGVLRVQYALFSHAPVCGLAAGAEGAYLQVAGGQVTQHR
jgi:hypothetical protein